MDSKSITSQIARLWSSISLRQKVSIALALVTVGGGLVFMTTWRKEKDFRPLFSNMPAEDAGAVVEKLKETGAEYRVADNGSSVLVPSSRVAEVRLQMASAGLPRTGRIGFELFDKTSLGATDFAEQVNFRRALEGELERSVRSLSEVEQARIHLTFPKDSVFLESKTPAKASVLIKLHPSATITPANVTAIVHLVASAVDGLTPEAVSVTDSEGNLLSRPKKPQDPDAASDELLEYRQKIERDLVTKVNSTLEPLLGTGKYRVGLSVDCDFTSGEQSEEIYDPEKSVMVTAQKTEENAGIATSGGVPGTSSALPRPAPRSTTGTGGTGRRTENVTYQTSRTVRRTRLPQGAVRKISASVLLDQSVRWELREGKQQRVLIPPTPETIKAIQEVVSAVLGLVPSRGDQLVVQTLPFDTTLQVPAPAAPVPVASRQKPAGKEVPNVLSDWRIWAGAGGAGILVLGCAVWARARRARARKKLPPTPQIRSATTEALPRTPEQAAIAEGATHLLAEAQDRVAQTATVDTLVDEIQTVIGQDPQLAASVLRGWLEEMEAQ